MVHGMVGGDVMLAYFLPSTAPSSHVQYSFSLDHDHLHKTQLLKLLLSSSNRH